jgi:hypothetical protein
VTNDFFLTHLLCFRLIYQRVKLKMMVLRIRPFCSCSGRGRAGSDRCRCEGKEGCSVDSDAKEVGRLPQINWCSSMSSDVEEKAFVMVSVQS